MVKRRGTYEVKILDKQLICLFCENNHFKHREMYMDLIPLGGGPATDQLTMQSFFCTSCGDVRMFQEKNKFDHTEQKLVSIIEYMEVMEK